MLLTLLNNAVRVQQLRRPYDVLRAEVSHNGPRVLPPANTSHSWAFLIELHRRLRGPLVVAVEAKPHPDGQLLRCGLPPLTFFFGASGLTSSSADSSSANKATRASVDADFHVTSRLDLDVLCSLVGVRGISRGFVFRCGSSFVYHWSIGLVVSVCGNVHLVSSRYERVDSAILFVCIFQYGDLLVSLTEVSQDTGLCFHAQSHAESLASCGMVLCFGIALQLVIECCLMNADCAAFADMREWLRRTAHELRDSAEPAHIECLED
ncbi:hypothetical protein KCU61_g454, partial [Aureobasidium melanogenum]